MSCNSLQQPALSSGTSNMFLYALEIRDNAVLKKNGLLRGAWDFEFYIESYWFCILKTWTLILIHDRHDRLDTGKDKMEHHFQSKKSISHMVSNAIEFK